MMSDVGNLFMIYIDNQVGYTKPGGDNKVGYINKFGEVVIEPKFDFAYSFKEGRAHVKINDKYGYINESGDMIIESQFLIAHN